MSKIKKPNLADLNNWMIQPGLIYQAINNLTPSKTKNCNDLNLHNFAKESNEIESIFNEERHNIHANKLEEFLKLKEIKTENLEDFVSIIEPGAYLRTKHWHKVFIGGKMAPKAPLSLKMLNALLKPVNEGSITPFLIHAEYEMIHPFTDGNGRSGRALWLWSMQKNHKQPFRFSFLQTYYYQTLQRYRTLLDQP